MSYNPLKNQDSLSELFSEINDSKIMQDRMIENKDNFDSFLVWFHKSMQVSRRNTLIFIRENRDIFTQDIQDYLSQFDTKKRPKEDFIDE